MKSCDFKTTQASTKAWFTTKGIVDRFWNILDLPRFRDEVTKWTDYAKEKYGVDKGRLIQEEEGGAKAVPNTEAFKAIDAAKGIYYSLKADLASKLKPVYSAKFLAKDEEDRLRKMFPPVYPNTYYHHSTIEFKPKELDNIEFGVYKPMKVIGRLTTDKLDVLLVDNPKSKNKVPHITLSTANGVKPFESNSELEKHADKIQYFDKPVTVYAVEGVFNGTKDITSLTQPKKNVFENKEAFTRNLPESVKDAIDFATKKHGEQKRKYTGLPYTTHLEEVAAKVAEYTDDTDIIIAALLHDTIEDTDTTYDEIKDAFGKTVADIVRELSDEYTKDKYPDLNRKQRKEKEAERLGKASEAAKFIKAADKLHNIQDIAENDPSFAVKYLQEAQDDANAIKTDTELYRKLESKIKELQAWLASIQRTEPIDELKESTLAPTDKTIVEILNTPIDTDTTTFKPTPPTTAKVKGVDKTKVTEKMERILKTLGVEYRISTLPTELAAQADLLNRLILFAEDSLTEDNFTEETMHFIVDVLEQKNKPLFEKLMSEIWKYPTYTDVLENYSSFPAYQNSDGSRNIPKLKKEAIAQLLTEKVLENANIQDKGFLPAVWHTIKAWLRDFFLNVPKNVRDEFSQLADEILHTDFISKEDRDKLGEGKFYAKRGNRVQKVQSKYRGKFGVKNTLLKDFSNADAEEVYNYIKEISNGITKVVEKEVNPDTGEMEEVEYYVTKTGKKQRITSMLKESTKHLYQNIDISERAEALREAKMQKGTAIHKSLEDIYKRYIDTNTGLRKKSPDLAPANIEVTRDIYLKLQAAVQQRLDTYPEGTRFLLETAVVNEEDGLAGTVDFMAVIPTANNSSFTVDILDWKTTDLTYVEHGTRKKRFDISPFNQGYWRNQLELYKTALHFYGIDDFRQVRAIPIVTETSVTKIDRNKPMSVENSIIKIENIKIGDVDPSKIPLDEFYNVPVPTYGESTGNERLDKVIEKLWGIYDRIQNTKYPDSEKFKKRKDLDDTLSAIRELQVKKKASKFVNLFHSSFKRYTILAEEHLDFLDDIEHNQKFITGEQGKKVNALLSELYDGIEFLSAFGSFPQVIRELYPEAGLTPQQKDVIDAVVKIGLNSANIKEALETSAKDIVDKLGRLYDIDKVSTPDTDKNFDQFRRFMSSILHREEKTIQLSARMINAMAYLGAMESQKYFDEKKGEFIKARKAFNEWIRKNNSSVEKAYDRIFKKEVLGYKYKGATYQKDGNEYFKNGKPVEAQEFFDILKANRNTVEVTEYGRYDTLIPTINSDFYDLLRAKQKEFNNLYNEGMETLADKNFKGRNRMLLLQAAYKKEILPWLQENFDLAKYDEDYKNALDAYKLSIKDLVFDTDSQRNIEKKDRFVEDWEAAHDIYTSPKALSSTNWLLRINEAKWQAPEYTWLLKPENKGLLDTYNLFTAINEKARKAGMLDESFNPKRFVPLVETDSLIRSLKLGLREFKENFTLKNAAKAGAVVTAGGLGGVAIGPAVGLSISGLLATRFLYNSLKEKFQNKYIPEKPESGFGTELDPITAKKKKVRKIAYKSVEDEDYLSDQMFYNYALWADHVIKFEVISNYETRFKMVQLLENSKKNVKGTDAYGNRAYKITPGGLLDYTKEALPAKNTSTENDLDRVIDNYLYSNSLEYKPSYFKIANALRDVASATFLGLKATSWGVNVIGAASAGTLQKGQKFDGFDFEAGLARSFGLRNIVSVGSGLLVGAGVAAISPVVPGVVGTIAGIATIGTVGKKLKDSIRPNEDERKIDYMLTLLGSRITSQYDKEAFVDFKDTWAERNESGDFAYWGYRKGDHWLQDAMAVAILKNTMVKDGKFVNIQEMVKKKYDSQRFKKDPTKSSIQLMRERRNVEVKIQKEIQELKKNSSIFSKMKPKGDGYDIGIDFATIEGHAQIVSLSNTIKGYSKAMIGNIDEMDKSIAKMTWIMQFLFQFKNWVPRVYGARLSDLEYDYEKNEITYGRYLAFTNALKSAYITVPAEFAKNLLPLLAFANPIAGLVGYGIAKGTQNTVKYNINLQEAGRAHYSEKKLEWIKQGKDMSHFPTEAEFIDLYVNGVRNTLQAIQQWAMVMGGVAMVATTFGGDDKWKWFWRVVARMMFGINKELGGDKDPDQLMNLVAGQNIIPVIGYLSEVKKFFEDYGSEVLGELQSKGGGKIRKAGKERMKKAHPYHRAMNITPGLREMHFWLLSSSKKYAKFSEVPQPKAAK